MCDPEARLGRRCDIQKHKRFFLLQLEYAVSFPASLHPSQWFFGFSLMSSKPEQIADPIETFDYPDAEIVVGSTEGGVEQSGMKYASTISCN
jgi:hypothetical protein